MRKRRTAEQIARLLQEAERDQAKGLTISEVCRKLGIVENSYYRWRRQHDAERVDGARRVRELEIEVDRLKLLVAELLLDRKMLQDVAKKKVVTAAQQRLAAGHLRETYKVSERKASRLLGRPRSTLRYRPRDRSREVPLVRAIERLARKHPRYGYRRIRALLERGGRSDRINWNLIWRSRRDNGAWAAMERSPEDGDPPTRA